MPVFAIVAAAQFNAADFAMRNQAGCFDVIMAVDGGYAHLANDNVAPHIVLGDFDSLGYRPDHPCVVVHPEKKDESDLELALDYALSHGATSVFVYGCLSGRLDHTLSALQVMARAAEEGLRVVSIGTGVCDAKAGMEGGVAVEYLVGPGVSRIDATDSAALRGGLSVLSMTDICTGVCVDGLAYSAQDATLTARASLGLSNQFTGRPASVSVKTGTLALFYPSVLCGNER